MSLTKKNLGERALNIEQPDDVRVAKDWEFRRGWNAALVLVKQAIDREVAINPENPIPAIIVMLRANYKSAENIRVQR